MEVVTLTNEEQLEELNGTLNEKRAAQNKAQVEIDCIDLSLGQFSPGAEPEKTRKEKRTLRERRTTYLEEIEDLGVEISQLKATQNQLQAAISAAQAVKAIDTYKADLVRCVGLLDEYNTAVEEQNTRLEEIREILFTPDPPGALKLPVGNKTNLPELLKPIKLQNDQPIRELATSMEVLKNEG